MSANSTVSGATVGPSFAEIFGPVFWGFCVSLLLGGVSAMQGYLYFTRYNDKLLLPHFGSFVPLNAVTKYAWFFVDLHFVNSSFSSRELTVECLIAAVITFISQMYFVYQLYIVNSSIPSVKSPGMTAAVMKSLIVVFGTIGLGCVGMMFLYPHSIFMNRNNVFAILAGINKGFGAAADIVATISMCMFLKSADTGIKRTSSMLKSLMHLVINRGLLVTAAQILLLITFFATAGHLYWLAVHINTTKLYVNTFFGMLNARTSLQERFATGHMSISGDTTANSQRFSAVPKMAAREKFGDLDTQDYPMGAIRVTTSSTVANI
ncbi:hypothetical protein K438DRAFT_2100370 [Mycena galopus ATCC 62051]|nr:hypothetical protein K438DRAFT_2100370 [Mycena galopus ATCC 62051]